MSHNLTESPHQTGTFGHSILAGLRGKHVYQGTVPAAEVQRRRAANRRARKSRQVNR